MSTENRDELLRKDLAKVITTEKNTTTSEDEGLVVPDLNLELESLDPLISTNAINTKTNPKKLIKSKRRHPNPDGWKRNIRKQLRQSGKEYVNTNGQVTAERRVKPACGSTCYLKCAERFSEDQRQAIHNNFWQLTDVQKNYFYWKFTSRCEPKRRRTFSAIPKRSYTFHYRFEVRGELMPVCSKFFFATLDITSIRIYYFYEHCYRGDICMPRELRSEKPEPDLTNLAERLDVIREHIASFPSERISGNLKKRYLSANLNLARMYKMYTKNVTDPLKQNWYCRVFNEEFNLDFRLPSKKNSQKERIMNGIENGEDEDDNDFFISTYNNAANTEMIEPQPTTGKLPAQLAQKVQTTTKLSGRLPWGTQPKATTKPHAQLARQLPQSAPLQWNESNITLLKPNMEVCLPTEANSQKVHIKQDTVDTVNREFKATNVPVLVQVPATTIISSPFIPTPPANIQLVEPQPTINGMPVQLTPQLPLPQLQSALPLQWAGNNITMSIPNPYSTFGWNH